MRWKLDTPIPASVAKLPVSPATPEQNPNGVPEIIFAALDTDIARELEPKFAAAGCAVISNSSAFRMQADVPLVIPEVNADHLALIPQQNWNGANMDGQKRGYIVTNPNCSAIGLVMALKAAGGAVRPALGVCQHHAGGQRRRISGRAVARHSGQRSSLHQE